MTLDLATVTGLWQALADRYGTRTVPKAASWRMRAIARFLAAIGVLSRRAFLDDFTTTIGHAIFVPFDPHAPADDAELWRRLCLCVHEHQHVVQWQRGRIAFVLGYLLSPRRRAEHEAEAYGTALELAAHTGRPLPDPAQLAARLRHYGVGPRHILHAERLLHDVATRAKLGEVRTEATRTALDWLASRAAVG